ncbi:MAG: hypothetical protein ABR508_00370 [Candidatus Baltobacteraceae bacterium]
MMEPVWDAAAGTAGGTVFGNALRAFAAQREVPSEDLARASGLEPAIVDAVLAGRMRVGAPALAHFIRALRSKPIEFMQKTGMLSLEVYASGLDPLYFLPEGPVRYQARIYMREINPRHPVPESDMTKRNPAIAALIDDPLLDAAGRVEMELAYLLRLAVQGTGGSL